VLVGVLTLVPLIYTQALPRQLLITDIHILPPPGPPPAPPPGQPPTPQPHRPTVNPFIEPTTIPRGVTPINEPPEPPEPVVGQGDTYVPGVPNGFGPGDGYTPGGTPWNPGTQPPPPPVVHAAPKQQLYRVGGDVIAARALYQPRPVYPPLATMARIQGTVVLQAILSRDGTIQDLKVVSGHPLLVRAALDAVKTWRYQPTLLNSEPVEVLTEIDVRFTLGE
jgi:periplasmic protein TonB